MKRLFVCYAATITLFILVGYSPSLACSYYVYPDPPAEYIVSRTKTIFLGTLLQKTLGVRKADGRKYTHHSLTFRIEDSLKGEQRPTYQVEYWEALTQRSSCDEDPPDPKVGEQWVIYVGYDEGGGKRLNVRYPELLSWRYAPDAGRSQVRMQEIRDALARPSSAYFGEVELAMMDTPPGKERNIQAELLDSDRTSVIQRAEIVNGRFSFPNLEPGVYVVRLRSSRLEKLLSPEMIQMQKDANDQSFYADFRIKMLSGLPEFHAFALADF